MRQFDTKNLQCPCGKYGTSGEVCESCGAEFALVPSESKIDQLLHVVGGGVIGLIIGAVLSLFVPSPISSILSLVCIVGGAILASRHWTAGHGLH